MRQFEKCQSGSDFKLKFRDGSLKVAPVAALQFLSKYRETGLLLFRASLGLIFIILIAPILWSGQGSWSILARPCAISIFIRTINFGDSSARLSAAPAAY